MKHEIALDWRHKRRAEYERRGLSMAALAIASIEGDEDEIARINEARADVKALFPKDDQ